MQWPIRVLTVAVLGNLALVAYGQTESDVSPCETTTAHDTDGDGISDAVERNNRVAFELGRCDRNASRAVGRPSAGSLSGGVNLPDRGSGYRHFRGSDSVDSDDWATLELLSCLEQVGRAVRTKGIEIGVGDLSVKGGGRFRPHVSHQNGVDADLRYVRRDRVRAPLDLRYQPKEYDLEATKLVFEAFFDLCNIEVIFVDIDRLDFTIKGQEERIVHAGGHSNHFHVRVGGAR